jgi:hypothetical protein
MYSRKELDIFKIVDNWRIMYIDNPVAKIH